MLARWSPIVTRVLTLCLFSLVLLAACQPNIQKDAPLRYLSGATIGKRNAPGQLSSPSAVAFGPDNEIAVADTLNDRLQWFSIEGKLSRQTPLNGPDGSVTPEALFVRSDGSFLVGELGDPLVYDFSADGKLHKVVQGWPGIDPDDAFINSLAEGPDGAIYIAETRGKRVITMNPDSTVRDVWQGPTARPFDDIMDLGVDPQGNVYVASDMQDRVVKRTPRGQVTEFPIDYPSVIEPMPDESFYVLTYTIEYRNAAGQPVSQWKGDDRLASRIVDFAHASDGSFVVLLDDYDTDLVLHTYTPNGDPIADFGSTKDQPAQFQSHSSFSVSPTGDLWLVDTGDRLKSDSPPIRLVHLDQDGQHLNTFDQLGEQPLVCHTLQVTALSDQTVFMADPCVSSVMHVAADGSVLQRWGRRGFEAGQFSLIRSIVAAPDEQSVYVVDEGNRRIDQFTLNGELIKSWQAAELGVQTPIGLALDAAGTIYLLDSKTQEVAIRSADGTVQKWPWPDRDDGVNTIAVDARRGRVYVGGTDTQLYMFDKRGGLLGTEGIGGDRGVLVSVGPTGRVYASTGYHKVYAYDPTD